jgi:P27 family predicted phage terminase small subunit
VVTNERRVRVPAHLGQKSKRTYAQLVKKYDLYDEPHALDVLALALEAGDRCEQAREVLAKEGAYYVDSRGNPRSHPAVAVERDSALRKARLLRELSLDAEPADARVARVGGGLS